MNLINFNNINYPAFQAEGNASQFAIPYAKHVCKGYGVDVGCKYKEWAFPGAIAIDKDLDDGNWDALHLPQKIGGLDYIYSSHCLEHVFDFVTVLNYWHSMLKDGGILFLYLPDYSQEYWRPWNNIKHVNIFTPEIIKDYMQHKGYKNIFTSGVDLNNSFMIVGEK